MLSSQDDRLLPLLKYTDYRSSHSSVYKTIINLGHTI